jgi:hypothetical protein
MKVKLSGWNELEKALAEELPKATARNALTKAGMDAMEPIRTRMAELAPFDPKDGDGDGNHLKDTMRSQAAKAKLARRLATARNAGVIVLTGPAPVGKRARANAGWQERGTVKMAANAYARPAIDGQGEAVIERLKEALADRIGKAKARIARKAARAAKG